jgi:exosome complex exonuclease DIS3/RRP44
LVSLIHTEHLSKRDFHTLAVLQVKANGLVVFVPRYGIEGPVFLTNKDGTPITDQQQQQQQQFMLDEDKQTVVSADGSMRYSVFDKCAVRISVVEGAARRRSIKLALVPRSELAPEDIVG